MLSEKTIKRLEAKQEELALLFLDQADVKKWGDLTTKNLRGDTYWNKKNCAQTLGLMVRIQSLLSMCMHKPAGTTPAPEDGAGDRDDEKIAHNAEREALAVIDRVRAKHKK